MKNVGKRKSSIEKVKINLKKKERKRDFNVLFFSKDLRKKKS